MWVPATKFEVKTGREETRKTDLLEVGEDLPCGRGGVATWRRKRQRAA